MPRFAGQSIPKYRLHRPTGQAVCTIHGRDHYLGLHQSKASKLEYDKMIGEWLAAGRQPLLESSDTLTVNELIVRYWKFAESHYVKRGQPTSEQAGIRSAMRLVRKLYGGTLVAEFGPLALKSIRVRQIDSGLSRRSINQNLGRIKRLFKWGVSEQLVPPETYQALATVVGLRLGRTDAKETAPILPVDESTVEATLPHMSSVVSDMVCLQRLTGMRPAEVCQIRPCDLDRSDDVWTYKPESHKTEHHGRERGVFVGPNAQGVLLKYLARDATAYCFRPVDSESKRLAEQEDNRKTPRSCGNRRGSSVKKNPKKKPGEKYETASYGRAIRYACDRAFPHPVLGRKLRSDLTAEEKAELKNWQSEHRWSPNRLRHSAATEIRRVFGLESAQIILGHSQANTTQIYAERDMAKGLEVAAKIG